jgi:DNA topoisomerase I
MAKNLLIVESPAKAKTIEKILGEDFEVKSCYGHIRDLERNDMGIDIKDNYRPRYIVPEDKEKVVKELKSIAKKSGEVWLATDEDREGEAISWHLCEVLGLDPLKTKRIVFHEITKPAIQSAVLRPRTVDMNLVNAQQARRVLDRIVGFELSPVLWRKMSMKNNLSAGRVQSVAVRIIAEREREINAFVPVSSFKIEALFTAKDVGGKPVTFSAEGKKQASAENAEKFLQGCIGAKYSVTDIQVKPAKKTPAAPFTTSTLQQEASRKLGYGVSRTMLLAQKLYESGKITYMRTDSVSLSELAMDAISNQIKDQYGEKYRQARRYKNKNESAQEAHEAIRPTDMANMTVDDADLRRLYDLIWKRTMASQMADAELEKTVAKIAISRKSNDGPAAKTTSSSSEEELTASGEVLKFDGFLKVYREDRDEEEEVGDEEGQEGMLPPLTVGQQLPLREMKALERFTRPLPRYTEAALVKKLEELGIGRPSTYAPTISTILKRGYVEKRDKEGVRRELRVLVLKSDAIEKVQESENTGAEKSKLFPTDLGLVVTDFLKLHFDDIMDYGFTARIEEEFDEVAQGKMVWSKMIDDFYTPFKKDVENTIENAERIKGERELGIDSQSGKKVIARMGRYGPMVQIGDVSDEEKPKFAKLKNTQSIETISYDEAMELFRLPRALGPFEEKEVTVNIGRFGPYIAHDGKFYSLGKEYDPYTINYAEATPMIVEKRAAKEQRTIKVFEKEKIQVLRGPYGPYIKQGLRNYKLPKVKQDTAADLTIDEVKAIIEDVKANPPKRVPKKKKK